MSEFVPASQLYIVESRTPIAHPAHQATDADVRRALEEREIRADGGHSSSGTEQSLVVTDDPFHRSNLRLYPQIRLFADRRIHSQKIHAERSWHRDSWQLRAGRIRLSDSIPYDSSLNRLYRSIRSTVTETDHEGGDSR